MRLISPSCLSFLLCNNGIILWILDFFIIENYKICRGEFNRFVHLLEPRSDDSLFVFKNPVITMSKIKHATYNKTIIFHYTILMECLEFVFPYKHALTS